ncbi:MAG: hypothetical protein R3313_04720 [Candidatus Saccharimonadales bacterium]|nr:hypothetical protein [Candidatus Saccharimonadales bacterium]
MESYDILVLILSMTLAIFLVLAIVFTIYLIRIARKVDEITEKAKSAVSSVEAAAKIFEKSAAPAAFSRIVANIVESFSERKKGKKK